MRGNTNVKDGIFLNASVDTYEVATGQTIVAGNMVKTLTETVSGFEGFGYVERFTLSDGRYIFFLTNQIRVLERNAGVYTQNLDPFLLGFYCQSVLEMGNDTYIVFYNSARYITSYAVKFDVQNDVVSSRQISQILLNIDSNFVGNTDRFFYRKNNVIHFGLLTNTSNYYDMVALGRLALSGTSYTDYNITNPEAVEKCIFKISKSNDASAGTHILMYPLENGYLLFLTNRLYSSAYSRTYPEEGRWFIYQPYTGNIIERRETASGSNPINVNTEGIGGVYGFRVVKEKNGYIKIIYCSESSGQNFYEKLIYIEEYTTSKMTVVQYTSVPLISFSTSVSDSNVSSLDELKRITGDENYDYYILNFYRGSYNNPPYLAYILKVGNVEDNVTIAESNSNIVYHYIEDMGTFFFTYRIRRVSSTNNAEFVDMSFDKSTLELTDLLSTRKLVYNATDENFVRGVAKQSGVAGDTIEVYIPSV